MSKSTFLAVAWHSLAVRDEFLSAWRLSPAKLPENVVMVEDVGRRGCAHTKNRAVKECINRGAEIVVVLDDDCHPYFRPRDTEPLPPLTQLLLDHEQALEPQDVELFRAVTDPRSRGTPHLPENRCLRLPVACSMGFWTNVGDYDAVMQLARGASSPMVFRRQPLFGRPFPLSGMNMAFRVKDWKDIAHFIEVPRYDDIWMGWIWQKIAYARGFCFNLNGPIVQHLRQSNVWRNLEDETKYAEVNETLWRRIWGHPSTEYSELRKLLPV